MPPVIFLWNGWAPVVRLLVVGSIAYLALVLLLRAGGKRTLGQMGAFDFVITVAIGATFGRVLTARDVSLAEAVTAFALLIGLQYAVTRLRLRSARFARLVDSSPTLLYFRGRLLHDAMLRERVDETELRAAAREHGAGSLEEVEAVILEPSGHLSVVRKALAGDHSALKGLRGG